MNKKGDIWMNLLWVVIVLSLLSFPIKSFLEKRSMEKDVTEIQELYNEIYEAELEKQKEEREFQAYRQRVIEEETKKRRLEAYEETYRDSYNSYQRDDCSGNYYNCANFGSQAEAQAMFLKCGGISRDIHWLDGDQDGIACETLP